MSLASPQWEGLGTLGHTFCPRATRLDQRSERTILRSGVASELWKVVLNLRFPSEDFLSKQVLLVEEENHRDGAQPSEERGTR